MRKQIIGLVGEIGSGKETFAELLIEIASPKKVEHIRYSDVLKQTLDMWSLSPTRENFTQLRIIMNNNFGEGALPKAIIKKAVESEGDIIILDGLRWEADLEEFKKLEDAILVYVTAPLEIRYQRIKTRAEKQGESAISLDEFKNGQETDAEKLIPNIGSKADITIINDGSFEDLKLKVEEFYEKYLK